MKRAYKASKQTKPTNAKKRTDAYAGKYKNVNTSMKTKVKYVAPIVRNLSNTAGVQDYQSAIITNQIYNNGYGHQGDFVNYTATSSLCHALAGDKAQCLTITVPGTENNKRNGNRVVAKSLNVIMNLRAAMVNVPDADVAWGKPAGIMDVPIVYPFKGESRRSRLVRVIIFIDQTSSLRVPQIEELLNVGSITAGEPGIINAGQVFSTTCQLRADATTRFKIIRNEMVSIPEGGAICWNAYIPLEGLAITYKSDANDPGNVNTNGVFMFVLNEIVFDTVNQPNANEWRNSMCRYDYTAKFRFIP